MLVNTKYMNAKMNSRVLIAQFKRILYKKRESVSNWVKGIIVSLFLTNNASVKFLVRNVLWYVVTYSFQLLYIRVKCKFVKTFVVGAVFRDVWHQTDF